MAPLAPSAAVDVSALSALFRSTTASYEYLFVLGLLRRLDWHPEPDPRVPLHEVMVELLAVAWYPHTFFRLSFGVWDRIGAVLDELSPEIGRHPLSFSSTDVERLRGVLRATLTPAHHRKLSRYVPHLLLAPFFQAELPWSFVLHDRVWNLVPVTRSVNSAKGDRLASPAYLDQLVELQCHGLVAARRHLARRTWERFAGEFEQDLRVPGQLVRSDPPDPRALQGALARAYRDVVPALESLAARQGFSPGWAFARA